MSGFQLIVLSEVKRPVRRPRAACAFVLVQFRSRAELMAEQGLLKVEAIVGWPTPRDVLKRATEAYGNERIAQSTILEYLRGGHLQAAAQRSAWEGVPRLHQTGPILMNFDHWDHVANQTVLSDFWVNNQIRFFHGHYLGHSSITVRFYDVVFDPQGVGAMLASAPPKDHQQSANTAPAANRGGRPRHDFWDDLWIEVCAHIHEQGIPEKQADIENMMLDWAAKHDHPLSLSSVRPRARGLFQRLQNDRTKT